MKPLGRWHKWWLKQFKDAWAQKGGKNADIHASPESVQNYIRHLEEMVEYEKNRTNLLDINGDEIMVGDTVWWDDNSNGKWSRTAIVEKNPDIAFRVIECNTQSVVGHVFHYGNFIYKDTENYLKILKKGTQ